MAQQDLAQVRATQAWIDQAKTLAQALIDHLLTKAVSLTIEQRSKNRGIGPENLSMVENGVAIIQGNAGWFPGTYNRAELLLDYIDRGLWLQVKTPMMQAWELYDDTLQAIESDIVRSVLAGRPFIEQSAELSGMGNNQVAEFLDWFKRFGGPPETTPPTTPPTP